MDERRKIMSVYGTKKSTILLMSIDINQAAEVLNKLSLDAVKEIVKCMIGITNIPAVEMHNIVLELQDIICPINYFDFFNKDYVFLMLKKALGEDAANVLLEDIMEFNNIDLIIKKLDIINPSILFQLIKYEHVQIITIIIMHISHYQAAKVLELFSQKQRFEIMLRLATFTEIKKNLGKLN